MSYQKIAYLSLSLFVYNVTSPAGAPRMLSDQLNEVYSQESLEAVPVPEVPAQLQQKAKVIDLLDAAHNNNWVLAQTLIKSSDINAQDAKGWTALMHFVAHENLPAVQGLLSEGALVDMADNEGNTARDLAEVIDKNQQPILDLLNKYVIKEPAMLSTKMPKSTLSPEDRLKAWKSLNLDQQVQSLKELTNIPPQSLENLIFHGHQITPVKIVQIILTAMATKNTPAEQLNTIKQYIHAFAKDPKYKTSIGPVFLILLDAFISGKNANNHIPTIEWLGNTIRKHKIHQNPVSYLKPALMVAADNNYPHLVKFLLMTGFNPDAQDAKTKKSFRSELKTYKPEVQKAWQEFNAQKKATAAS